MLSMHPTAYQESENEELKITFRLPKGFIANDSDRIKAFSARLVEIRKKRMVIKDAEDKSTEKQDSDAEKVESGKQKDSAKTKEDSANEDEKPPALSPTVTTRERWRQEDLARVLHITKVQVFNYEQGRIKSIPMDKIARICGFYDVTPHYILGLVDDEHGVLCIDDNGDIELDSAGKPRVLTLPMGFDPSFFQSEIESFKNLFAINTDLFFAMADLARADKRSQDIALPVIQSILETFG